MHDLRKLFRAKFGTAREPILTHAPGRVNLLGEHTDYNEGFVLPMATNVGITMAGVCNGSSSVNLYSADYSARDRFDLADISSSGQQKWSNYIRGVCKEFQLAGLDLQGMDVLIQGNVPQGAGLSSSAALEVAAALLIASLHNRNLDAVELVKLAQRAENNFVGVASGIMDQFASMMGQEDHALLLDCRTLEYELVPTPFAEQDFAIVVANSQVRRGLVDSAYNTRRQECIEAVEALQPNLPGITSLRDVGLEDLPLINALPGVFAQRARHVVSENNRVLKATSALKVGDLTSFGQDLTASHRSLQHDFEVSCPELNLLVELALKVPGVLGSRMTGAGFGGCTISLVPHIQLSLFEETVAREYGIRTGLKADFYIFSASQGARIVSP